MLQEKYLIHMSNHKNHNQNKTHNKKWYKAYQFIEGQKEWIFE